MPPSPHPPPHQRFRRHAKAAALVTAVSVVAGLGSLVGTGGTHAEGTAPLTAPRAAPELPAEVPAALPAEVPARTERAVTLSRAEPRQVAPTPAPLPPRTFNRTTYRPQRTATGNAARVSKPPAVKARSWIVADLGTGRILATHQHRRRLPQASTIKLLSAVTASRTVPAKPVHRVTRAEAHPKHCSCAGLTVGARYTREALTAGMLLPSGNDAAEALAGSHPEGRAAFIAAMNAYAEEIGATDTHVVNPSGLTDRGAVSSARDLLLFLRAAEDDEVVAPLLDRATYRFGPVGGGKRVIRRGTDYVNKYVATNPGTRGKNGFTTPAKNTLVVTTPIKGRRIAVAILGSPSGYSTKGARVLTAWVSANYTRLAPLGTLPAGG